MIKSPLIVTGISFSVDTNLIIAWSTSVFTKVFSFIVIVESLASVNEELLLRAILNTASLTLFSAVPKVLPINSLVPLRVVLVPSPSITTDFSNVAPLNLLSFNARLELFFVIMK